jgi:hypothetical protein
MPYTGGLGAVSKARELTEVKCNLGVWDEGRE